MDGVITKNGDAVKVAAESLRPSIFDMYNRNLSLDVVHYLALATKTRIFELDNRKFPSNSDLVQFFHLQKLFIERLRLGNTGMPIGFVLFFHWQSLIRAAIGPNEDCCTTDAFPIRGTGRLLCTNVAIRCGKVAFSIAPDALGQRSAGNV